MFSVTNVLISAVEDAGFFTKKLAYGIVKRIYTVTYPFWIQDYKGHDAFVEAVGLMYGMSPSKNYNLKKLSAFQKAKIYGLYLSATVVSFLTPTSCSEDAIQALWFRKKKIYNDGNCFV